MRAVRDAAPDGFQVLLHADPVTYHVGANPGVDPEHILSVADGVVVPCAGGPGLLAPFAGQGREGAVLAANLGVVSGMGGSPGTLTVDLARARALGATELRLYHAGLASDGDLSAVREALVTLSAAQQQQDRQPGQGQQHQQRPVRHEFDQARARREADGGRRVHQGVEAVAVTRPSSASGVSRCTAVSAAISTQGSPTPIAAPHTRATGSEGTACAATATAVRTIPYAANRRSPSRRSAGPESSPTTIEPAPWAA